MSIFLRSDAGKLGKRYRALARKHPETVRTATREIAMDAQALFGKTVMTWSRKPEFTVEEVRSGFRVGTSDPVYGYVDKGTPPHEIRPRRAKVLTWTRPYTPKTKPNVISSFAGGRGNVRMWARRVMHPGVEARNFSIIVRERTQAGAANKVRAALRALYLSEGFGL